MIQFKPLRDQKLEKEVQDDLVLKCLVELNTTSGGSHQAKFARPVWHVWFYLKQTCKTAFWDSCKTRSGTCLKIFMKRTRFNHGHWRDMMSTGKSRKKKSIFHSVVFVFFSLRYSSHWSDTRHLNSTTLMNTPGGATQLEHFLPSRPHSWRHCGCCMPSELLQGHWNRYCDGVKLNFITIVVV